MDSDRKTGVWKHALFSFFYFRIGRNEAARNFPCALWEGCLPKFERRLLFKNYRVKTNFDRGYVNAMDKVRVFIESNQKVMFVNTDEYKDAKNARAAYVNAITLIRAGGIVRATRSRNDLFLIRNDI